jgi:hypothetical protein
MPLEKKASQKAFHKNIKEMVDAGHPVKQAVAAAYSEQSEARKDEK